MTTPKNSDYTSYNSHSRSSRRSHRTRLDAGLTRDPYNTQLSTSRRRLQASPSRRSTKEIFDYHPQGTPTIDNKVEEIKTTINDEKKNEKSSITRLLWGMLGAIGVVYGDLTTSPIYAANSIYDHSLRQKVLPTKKQVIGYTSTSCWLIILVVCIKYCYFVMHADYNGEGGSYAIYELMKKYKIQKWSGIILTILSCLAAALLSGDCIITPAISVLSALEGLSLVQHSFEKYIVSTAVIILLLLYFVQSYGTKFLGRLFGPILLTWVCLLFGLGVWNLRLEPSILIALSPYEVIRFWFIEGKGRFVDLSSVLLCITGCEAMFADMGHFGRKPIVYAWFILIFPAAIIQYLGQGSFLLSCLNKYSADEVGRTKIVNEMFKSVFWVTVPKGSMLFYYFVLIIATLSTISASQAVISGAFTIMAQASQLQFLPRLRIVYTNPEEKGQVYVRLIAVVDAVIAVLLVAVYQESIHLAAAYGVAVSSVSLITSFMVFCYVAPFCWKYSKYVCFSLLLFFGMIDSLLWASTLTKLVQGGWITVLVSAVVCLIMALWTNVTWRKKQAVNLLKEKEALSLDSSDVSRRPRDMMVPSNTISLDIQSIKEERNSAMRSSIESDLVKSSDNVPVDHRYLSSIKDAARCRGLGIFLTGTSLIETQVRDYSLITDNEDDRIGLMGIGLPSQIYESSRTTPVAPVGLSRIASRFKSLPEYVLLVTVEVCSTPFIDDNERIMTQVIDDNSKGIVCAAKLLVGWAEPLDSADVLESLLFAANNNKGSFPLPIEERLQHLISEVELSPSEITKEDADASPKSGTGIVDSASQQHSFMIKLSNGDIEPFSIFTTRKIIQPSVNASRLLRVLVSSYNAIKDMFEVDATKYLNLPPDNTTEVGIAVTLK